MTKRDLIDAYVGGHLARREFVRGLTALGVSAGAALAYAQHLVPSAAASPGRNAAGFVVRAQVDADYGTACQIGSDLEGALAVLEALQAVEAVLDSGIADFLEDLPSLDALGLDTAAVLETIASQLAEQIAAVEEIVASLGGTPPAVPDIVIYLTEDNFGLALANSLNAAASLLAGVVPAIQDGEVRQTLTSIAIVVGRNAGFANVLIGDPPSDSAFEPPTCP